MKEDKELLERLDEGQKSGGNRILRLRAIVICPPLHTPPLLLTSPPPPPMTELLSLCGLCLDPTPTPVPLIGLIANRPSDLS